MKKGGVVKSNIIKKIPMWMIILFIILIVLVLTSVNSQEYSNCINACANDFSDCINGYITKHCNFNNQGTNVYGLEDIIRDLNIDICNDEFEFCVDDCELNY
mgnify:CR=1 FL=1